MKIVKHAVYFVMDAERRKYSSLQIWDIFHELTVRSRGIWTSAEFLRFLPLMHHRNGFEIKQSKLWLSDPMQRICDLLSMLAVFSVVISISGSVKYSDATHLPFSGPEGGKKMKKRAWENMKTGVRGGGALLRSSLDHKHYRKFSMRI